MSSLFLTSFLKVLNTRWSFKAQASCFCEHTRVTPKTHDHLTTHRPAFAKL